MRVASGFLKNRALKTPKGSSTRPTSEKLRQAVFNILQNRVIDATFLDLFAGSGAMGIEALSRGASHATFIENHPQALSCLKSNVKELELNSLATVISFDATKALKKLIKNEASFDFIYVDPPYAEHALQESILTLIDNSSLLKQGGVLFVEVGGDRSLEDFENLKVIKKREVGCSTLFEYEQPCN